MMRMCCPSSRRGGDPPGHLLVAVGGHVHENGLGAVDGLSRVGGHLGGGAGSPDLAPQLDEAQLLGRVQLLLEALVVVEGDLEAAHGHDAGNSVAGSTGTNYSDFLNHNSDISFVCVGSGTLRKC